MDAQACPEQRQSCIQDESHQPDHPESMAPAVAAETDQSNDMSNDPPSPIVTVVVGQSQRLFAAHQEILCKSPFFYDTIHRMYVGVNVERISLPLEEPEAFNAIIQYLYEGDYYPRIMHNEQDDSWTLETSDLSQGLLYHHGLDMDVLRDTVIYCSAEKYGLQELKSLALRKQNLYRSLKCDILLASARYAYANTPETDMDLRTHFLTLVLRNLDVFRASNTMQREIYNGGSFFFSDLFVAMCARIDDILNSSDHDEEGSVSSTSTQSIVQHGFP